MTDIKGKWALVTGASRGLGRLAALCLAEQGCNVILHSRSLEHTAQLAEQMKEMGVEVRAVAAELSSPEQVNTMLAQIDALGVPVDIILNNAAIQIAYRTEYMTTPAEDYTVSFMINTTAPMMICYHFMPTMIERGFGRVVNTTSGIDKEPQQAGYSASKAALDKVTADLGATVEGTDVMINLVDPGWCRTDLGGPNAPNAPEDAMPGLVVGVFADDKKSGRIFRAQEYKGMTLEQAAEAAMGK